MECIKWNLSKREIKIPQDLTMQGALGHTGLKILFIELFLEKWNMYEPF